MKPKSGFEDYLINIHAKNYVGCDDDMAESCEEFICDMSTDEMIEYADRYCAIKDSEIATGVR